MIFISDDYFDIEDSEFKIYDDLKEIEDIQMLAEQISYI